VTVSHTKALLQAIEQELPTSFVYHMLNLHDSNLEIVDAVIGQDSPAYNKPLNALKLPGDSLVLLVVRNGKVLVPRGDLVLANRDEIIVLSPRSSDVNIRELLRGAE